MKRFITKALFLFILFISFSLQNSITQIHVPHSKTQEEFVYDGFKEKSSETTDEMLQFTAGGHIFGFRKGDVFIASGDHALRIEFVNARPVSPVDEGISPDTENNRQTAEPLGRVSYSDLWDGVTLVYERKGTGVVKSTYTIQPEGADASSLVDRIRLRYNVPVAVDGSGNLVFSFDTGQMRESYPVAWQEIKGEHIPVEVSFCSLNEREVSFKVGSYDPQFPLVIDGVLIWITFMGSSSFDYGNAIAVDTSGNVYVAGLSDATWGTPVNPHAGSAGFFDAFVAKLNSSGVRQWHTFMGAANFTDDGYGIAVDGAGNVYVVGRSNATWGTPVNPHAGGDDAFVAKLNSSGVRQWHTFMGSTDIDIGYAIAVDGSGNVYVAGRSSATWGSPVNAHAGLKDAFAAKLDGSGIRQWHTFMGSASDDYGGGIAVDTSGNLYVAGYSDATWGTPVYPFAALSDAFAAKLNSSGVRQWHTFMGSFSDDNGWGIAVGTSGNVYVAGRSNTTWGTPINPHAGGNNDTFAAKLDGSGVRQWHTFMGSASDDYGYAIAVDTSRNVYVAGNSYANWGTPINPHTGGLYDAFAAKIADTGNSQMLWAHPNSGSAHLWTLNSSLGIASTKGFALGAGWWVVSYHRNADGTGQMLWANPGMGWAHLWTLNASLGIVSTKGFAMPAGWWATGYHRNSDGTGYLLWALPGTGLAHLWTLNASNQIVSTKGFAMAANWWAISYHRNADGTSQLLWTHPGNGLAHLWTLNASLAIASTRGYALTANWWATSYHRNVDGTSQLFWTHPGNSLGHLWTLNSGLGLASTKGYSFASGWWGFSFNGSTSSSGDILLSPEMRVKN